MHWFLFIFFYIHYWLNYSLFFLFLSSDHVVIIFFVPWLIDTLFTIQFILCGRILVLWMTRWYNWTLNWFWSSKIISHLYYFIIFYYIIVLCFLILLLVLDSLIVKIVHHNYLFYFLYSFYLIFPSQFKLYLHLLIYSFIIILWLFLWFLIIVMTL